MNKKRLTVVVVILQLIFLGSMIGFHQHKLGTSTRIMLKTVPIDPLSAFRGRFVSLRYEISRLPVSLLKDIGPNDLKGGDILFVKLKKAGEYWQAEGVYRNMPEDREVYLRGRLSDYFFSYGRYYPSQVKELPLEYDIESFFLNEQAADTVEKSARPLGNWQEQDRMRKERFAHLDAETQRIHKANISEWWFKTLKNELDVWFKDGLIDQKTRESIYNKYAVAVEKILQVEKEISSSLSSNQKPIIVEVAIDSSGNGYPARLFCNGKVYK